MKKIMGFIFAFMLIFSSLVYAAGGQECGDKAEGPAGTTGDGTVEQNQAPNP